MNNPTDPGDVAVPARAYLLGHSDRELDRLSVQARLIDPITRRFFRDAGIVPGMRVLDVGSGVGDVAFLAAELVGDKGDVLGMDRVPKALAVARQRGEAREMRNVSFREGDPTVITFDRPFDAVVGRYILMFQHDPTVMLRKLAAHVRPGGVVVFHEPDWYGVRSFPVVPTYDLWCKSIVETLRRHGDDPRMGVKLHSMFVAAGLPAPSMRLEAVIGGGATCSDHVHLTMDLAVTLLPEMERLGIVKPGEVDVDTLVERVFEEVIASGSVIGGRSEIGAWSRTQSSLDILRIREGSVADSPTSPVS